MKTSKLSHRGLRWLLGIGCGVLLLAASGPGRAAELNDMTAQKRALTIRQLQGASELDYSRANTANIDPTTHQDFQVQAQNADLVARRLQYGVDVPQAEIDEAMVIPHEPRTPAANARLINRLKEVRHLDHTGIRDYSVDPVFSQDFAVQASKVNQVLANLEVGQNVSRVEINDALEVPPNP
jgi:hypothetical protein